MEKVQARLANDKAMIKRNMHDELAFIATENVIMRGTKGGGDRQDLHERVRELSMEAVTRMKQEGLPNDLMDRMKADDMLGLCKE